MTTTAYGGTTQDTATTTRARDNVTHFPSSNSLQQNGNNDYNNNYHVRARARVYARAHVTYADVCEAYEDVFGRQLPRFVEREIYSIMGPDPDWEFLEAVIEYTACAPRPSWAYARTVLIRNLEKGVNTSLAFEQSLANRGRAGNIDLGL